MIVYTATNVINNKVYVGITSKELGVRIKQHYTASRKPKFHFHMALSKYSKDDFIWNIIDDSDSYEDLKEMEVSWIYYYNSYNNGYNSTLGGDGHLGYVYTEQARINLSNSRRGYKMSQEQKDKLSEINKGKILSNSTKAKMRTANLGENSNNAKLNSYSVLEIRRICSTGEYTYQQIADMYNISRCTVGSIKRRETWKHLL